MSAACALGIAAAGTHPQYQEWTIARYALVPSSP